MSPHRMDPLLSAHNLSDYDISQNGFLPSQEPLTRLEHPILQPWEEIIDQLPGLLATQNVRTRIDELPVISAKVCNYKAIFNKQHMNDNDNDGLPDDKQRQWQRAYLVLGMLAQSYIWGGTEPAERLPPSISTPFLDVAEHLDVKPVATYAALNLWNWRLIGPDPRQPENWQALHTFTGTEDESWFFMISNAMEVRAGPLIKTLLGAMRVAEQYGDAGVVTDTLEELSEELLEMAALLDRMQERCDPMVFYHQIRPYLAGSQNMEAVGLPMGVLYDEGNGRGRWRKYRGGSAGQSSLIQLFDAVLGVRHSGSKGFHEEMREYMPGPHARFIRDIEAVSNIKAFVEDQRLVNTELVAAYDHALASLCTFRDKHVQLVTRYIVLPSRRVSPVIDSRDETLRSNLATASMNGAKSGKSSQELVGTGGTAIIPFLRQTRDETRDAAFSL